MNFVYSLEVRRCIPRVKQAIILLEEMFSDSCHTCELLLKLYFILGQLENAIVKKPRRRYNIVTMILSLKSHLSSSSCYKQLRQMDCISLPHESSLRRMYSSFGLDTEYIPFNLKLKQVALLNLNVISCSRKFKRNKGQRNSHAGSNS